MEEKNDNGFKIIKEGKKISKKEIERNEKNSRNRTIFQYLIPAIVLIVLSIAYILTQMNIILILFGIFMFLALWGWDCSSRTCMNCKKWNSIIWTKTERLTRKTNISKTSMFGKSKKKAVKEKFTRLRGKCKTCDCEYEIEKNRIL